MLIFDVEVCSLSLSVMLFAPFRPKTRNNYESIDNSKDRKKILKMNKNKDAPGGEKKDKVKN